MKAKEGQSRQRMQESKGGGKTGCRTLEAAINIFGSEGAKCWVEIKADGMGCSGCIFINLVLFHNSALLLDWSLQRHSINNPHLAILAHLSEVPSAHEV